MVQPRESRVAVSWPMVTRGSHRTVLRTASISRMSTRLTLTRAVNEISLI